MSYLPTVAWQTVINNVAVVNSTTYTLSIANINPNDPGASSNTVAVGYYIRDWVGHTYSITGINVGGDPLRIQVVDDFLVGIGPQQGRLAYVYKSVGDGYAPYLAPVRHFRLDDSALDYSRAIELDVMWKHRGVQVGTEDNVTKVTLEGISMKDVVAGWTGGKGITLYPTPINHNDQPGLQGIGPDYYHSSYEQYRGISAGSGGYLPKYNVAGWLENSKFTDDGTTPKYNTNTIWHSGNDGHNSGLDADTVDTYQGSSIMASKRLLVNNENLDNIKEIGSYCNHTGNGSGNSNFHTNYGIIDISGDGGNYGGIQRSYDANNGDLSYRMNWGGWQAWRKVWTDKNSNLSTVDWTAKDLTVTTAKIGSLSGYLKGTAGVVGAVSSIPESDITFTDITTGNVSTSKHGYFPKLPTPSGKYLRDDMTWQTVSGGTGTPGGLNKQVQWNDNGSFAGVIGTSVQDYYNSQQVIVFSGEGTGLIFTDTPSNSGNGFAMRSGNDLAIHLGYSASGDSGYLAPFDFRFDSGILGWDANETTPTSWSIKYAGSGSGDAQLGFFNTAPIVKPTITGSKGGNAALTSLLTQLSNLGLITDSTT